MRTEHATYEIEDMRARSEGERALGLFGIIVPIPNGLEIRTLEGRALRVEFPADEAEEERMFEDRHGESTVLLRLPAGKIVLRQLTCSRFAELRGFIPGGMFVPPIEDDGELNAYLYGVIFVAGDR